MKIYFDLSIFNSFCLTKYRYETLDNIWSKLFKINLYKINSNSSNENVAKSLYFYNHYIPLIHRFKMITQWFLIQDLKPY